MIIIRGGPMHINSGVGNFCVNPRFHPTDSVESGINMDISSLYKNLHVAYRNAAVALVGAGGNAICCTPDGRLQNCPSFYESTNQRLPNHLLHSII